MRILINFSLGHSSADLGEVCSPNPRPTFLENVSLKERKCVSHPLQIFEIFSFKPIKYNVNYACHIGSRLICLGT